VSLELRPTYPVTTERLHLRPLTLADAPSLVAYRSIPELCRYVPFEAMDLGTVTARLETLWANTEITAEGQALTLGAELIGSGELVGDVVLFFRSEADRGGEIGWIFHPGHAGHGYATEAARGFLELAFRGLGLHRVVARVDARNDASLRLCERLGMRREAHLVKNEWFKGEWSSEIDFAILNEEWAGPQGQ
jgi:RimJ/RimL family protein N-acetyltransferase